jgi:nitrogen regulatory protein PII
MKELKAYLRVIRLEGVLRALQEAGAEDITVIRVDAIAGFADPAEDRARFVRRYSDAYSTVAKLEIVASDRDTDRFVEIIKEHARTGAHGDGRVFVSSVERCANIRTGEEGEEAL